MSYRNAQRESDFCNVLEFVAEFNIGRLYNAYIPNIRQRWIEKRKAHDVLFQNKYFNAF